jgi:hypothetical protein
MEFCGPIDLQILFSASGIKGLGPVPVPTIQDAVDDSAFQLRAVAGGLNKIVSGTSVAWLSPDATFKTFPCCGQGANSK